MSAEKYTALKEQLQQLPFISPAQVERWVSLQRTIDGSKDYLIRAIPEARVNIDTAQKILSQSTYTLVFFGGTGVGKSTTINSILGRNLLPSGAVTAVTGTIVYIEQAAPSEEETLTLNYWSKDEFSQRVRRLCQLAKMTEFDITTEQRSQAQQAITQKLAANADSAKTEQDEYLEILLDCIATYDNHEALMKSEMPPPQVYDLSDENAYNHLREDGFKGSAERQIRLVKSATFRIQPRPDVPNLLMNGHLRIVDVPGLGAGMRLHEAITLEEMKKEDAMIVLVSDAGRQRVDELKSLQAVHWVKDNRLKGLKGSDLDEAAAKIFYVVNGGNIRQAYDRLNSGLPQAEAEIKEVTRHLAPHYWEQYKNRGDGRPYFLVMPPSALYVEDPDNAPSEFESETKRIMEVFGDQLGNIPDDPLHPDSREKLLELSEIPQLRQSLINFIQDERVITQIREAESRVRTALSSLKGYYESELASRNVHPPFDVSWETLQERRYETLLTRQQKELPRAFHNALVELSRRTNNDETFRRMVRPTLQTIRQRVMESVDQDVDALLEQYGIEHWDNRDVTFDNLIWGTSGIELPIQRILYQIELTMQEAVSKNMPRLGDVMSNELKRTLQAHEVKSRLERASYGQNYEYNLPDMPGRSFTEIELVDALLERVAEGFREVCEQAAMYELMNPERSIHARVSSAGGTNESVLNAAVTNTSAATPGNSASETVVAQQSDDIGIKIIMDGDDDSSGGSDDFGISLLEDEKPVVELEHSYADMLDDIAGKTKRIFADIVDDLFADDDLLPRLRRLFWLEATRAERDFNTHIIKPMMRQHDRKLDSNELRDAMEPDLESVSDMESLMRTWEGLDLLQKQAGI